MSDRVQSTQKFQTGKVDVAAMKREAQGGAIIFDREYKLGEGEHLVRFLPPAPGSKQYYFRFYTHYLNRQVIICPQHTWNQKCPGCTVGDMLYRSENPADNARGKDFYRSEKYVAAIINLKRPTDGVLPIVFGVKIRNALASLFVSEEEARLMDLDEMDITDQEKGAYIRITGQLPAGSRDKRDISYSTAVVKRNAGIPYAKWYKEMIDLRKLVQDRTLSLEELRDFVVGQGGSEEEIDESDLVAGLNNEETEQELNLEEEGEQIGEVELGDLGLEEDAVEVEPEKSQPKPQPKSTVKPGTRTVMSTTRRA